MRQCRKCLEELPLNANMFDRDREDSLGFKHICKMCRSFETQEKEDREMDERLSRFDEQSMKLLGNLMDSGTAVPHHRELFEAILQVMGGVAGVAGHFMTQLLASKLGSKERTALLSMLFKMSEKVTDTGTTTIDYEMMSDADLERARLELLKQCLGNAGPEEIQTLIARARTPAVQGEVVKGK